MLYKNVNMSFYPGAAEQLQESVATLQITIHAPCAAHYCRSLKHQKSRALGGT